MALLSKATQSFIFLISTAFFGDSEMTGCFRVNDKVYYLDDYIDSRAKNNNQLVISLDSSFSFNSSSHFKPNIAFSSNIKFDFRLKKQSKKNV